MGKTGGDSIYEDKHGTIDSKNVDRPEDNSKPEYSNHRYYHRIPSPPSNNVRHSHIGSYERMESSYNRRSYLQGNIRRAREFIDSDDDSYAGDKTLSCSHKKEVNENVNESVNESVYLNQVSLTICMMLFTLYWIFCNMLEGFNQPRVVTKLYS